MAVELTSAAEVFDLLDSKTNDPIIRVLRGQVSDSLLITTAYAIIADRKDRALISPAGEVSHCPHVSNVRVMCSDCLSAAPRGMEG